MATLYGRLPYHQTPYREGNSPEGIRRAKRAGRPIDLDAHITRDHRWANVHAGIPGREGFRYTAASVAAGVPKWKRGRLCLRRVEDMSWVVVRTLRTDDGHAIQSFGEALMLAGSLGVDVEVEPKGVPMTGDFQHLRSAAAHGYGKDWAEHVAVKRLTVLPGWRTCLKRAHTVGFTTVALRVRYPASLPSYVDHYRR